MARPARTVNQQWSNVTEVGDSARNQAPSVPGADLLALVGEIGELSAIFQWLSDEQADAVMSDPRLALQVRGELADIFAYLLQLADSLDVDLREALEEKIELNIQRYPADRVRGKAIKYTDLSDGPPS